MKHLPTLAGALLGLAFVVFGANFFLNFIPMPADPSPADAPHKLFMAALFPTGYLAFVKVLEIAGGVLVALPRTRNIGLLVLGPIIVNILCFHVFLMKGATLVDPVNIAITGLSLFLLWSERKAFAALVQRPTA
jgi:putative oxidoreductase